MHSVDLLSIRQEFNQKNILLCFNGPISRSLIEEIGNALKSYLRHDEASPSASMDVFSVYIEMTQNIRHYAQSKGYPDANGGATVVVGRLDQQHYWVLAGNVVERDDGQALQQRVEALSSMDKAALKAAYKAQLRQPRDKDSVSGAGLGLYEIARKASQPLSCRLEQTPDNRAFFSLLAIV
jgi:hypothetical protein